MSPGDVRALRVSHWYATHPFGGLPATVRYRAGDIQRHGRAATRSKSYARERIRVKKSEPDGVKKVGTLAMTAGKSLQMAGATGLEPATFDVTGRTKLNGTNDSC